MTKYQVGDQVIVNDADAHNHNLVVGEVATIHAVAGRVVEGGVQVYDVKGTSRRHGGESLQLILETGLTPVPQPATVEV